MSKTRRAKSGTAAAQRGAVSPPQKFQQPIIRFFEYNAATYRETAISGVEDLPADENDGNIRWLDIDGLGDSAFFRALGEKYGLHPLAIEDVVQSGQRPKLEPYENLLFIVLQIVHLDDERNATGEQVSMFLKDRFLITIQETIGTDVFSDVRERIRSGGGYVRKLKADYLAYALLDSIVDRCFPILESMGEALEDLESEVLQRQVKTFVPRLHEYKRTLLQLRRYVWPERDVCSALLHDESGIIDPQTKVFIRDAYDHTVQLMDFIDSYRDFASSVMEIYLSFVGMRTNEIMRVLTVISSIFIPLTFIAGLYGMNFENMPELHHPWGYRICLGVMLTIAVGQFVFFKRKRWF